MIVGNEPGMESHRIEPSGLKTGHLIGGGNIFDKKISHFRGYLVGMNVYERHDLILASLKFPDYHIRLRRALTVF
jgi:hypothetical protein